MEIDAWQRPSRAGIDYLPIRESSSLLTPPHPEALANTAQSCRINAGRRADSGPPRRCEVQKQEADDRGEEDRRKEETPKANAPFAPKDAREHAQQ